MFGDAVSESGSTMVAGVAVGLARYTVIACPSMSDQTGALRTRGATQSSFVANRKSFAIE
jgi:hypothetical protein